MKIGIKSLGTNYGSIDDIVAESRQAAECGLYSIWMPTFFGMDALTCIAIVAREVDRIRFGTSIVPIYTRHPFAMAQQALTVQAAAAGRLTLGVGVSHRQVVEDVWQLSFNRPAAAMRGYLGTLNRLVGQAQRLEHVPSGPTGPSVKGADAVPVLVAALGPAMLQIAGSLADGIVLWCVGPKALEKSMLPQLSAAAMDAGRPAPRVVSALPTCVTRDSNEVRGRIAKQFSAIDQLPTYRRVLDTEGADGIADISLVGDLGQVKDGIRRLEAAGVTEFTAMIASTDQAERRATLEALGGA